jgi:hypothetical protein
MTGRVAGALMIVLALAVAVLPALPWYSTAAPGGSVSATGLGGAGELWLLPALGAVAIVAGAALLTAPPERAAGVARVAGPVVAAAAGLALAWALRAALDPRVTLTASAGSETQAIRPPVSLEPAAVLTPIAAGALLALGALAALAGWRR